MMSHGPLASTRKYDKRYLGKQHKLFDLCNSALHSVCKSHTQFNEQTFAKSMVVGIPSSNQGKNLSAFIFPSRALQMLSQHCLCISPKNKICVGCLLLAVPNFFQSVSLKKKKKVLRERIRNRTNTSGRKKKKRYVKHLDCGRVKVLLLGCSQLWHGALSAPRGLV